MESSFISCDWGTSSFRLRLIDGSEGSVRHEILRNQGIRDIHHSLPDDSQQRRDRAFAQVLGEAADTLLAAHPDARTLPIVLSGMASSSIGWRELPYAPLPFALSGANTGHDTIPLVTPNNAEFPVLLVSGVASESEIMRGEECELIGIATLEPYQTLLKHCLIILPGTHSKHVTVSEQVITDFYTSMTGELFESISQHTILASSVTADSQTKASESGALRRAFSEGVETVRDRGIMNSLFQTRTRAVLQHQPNDQNRAFLSGLLIGAELAPLQDTPSSQPILIAAGAKFAESYQLATQCLGLDNRATFLAPDHITQLAIRGQARLRQLWTD